MLSKTHTQLLNSQKYETHLITLKFNLPDTFVKYIFDYIDDSEKVAAAANIAKNIGDVLSDYYRWFDIVALGSWENSQSQIEIRDEWECDKHMYDDDYGGLVLWSETILYNHRDNIIWEAEDRISDEDGDQIGRNIFYKIRFEKDYKEYAEIKSEEIANELWVIN